MQQVTTISFQFAEVFEEDCYTKGRRIFGATVLFYSCEETPLHGTPLPAWKKVEAAEVLNKSENRNKIKMQKIWETGKQVYSMCPKCIKERGKIGTYVQK